MTQPALLFLQHYCLINLYFQQQMVRLFWNKSDLLQDTVYNNVIYNGLKQFGYPQLPKTALTAQIFFVI